MPRHKRRDGESCGNCVSWTRIMQRNPDLTVKIERDPVGTCDCGPPSATAVPIPQKSELGRTAFAIQEFTTFPPSTRSSMWCGQYEIDPVKLA